MAFSFSQWYKVNGERLNKQRRDRYNNDPEYRARVLKTNQKSRQERKSSDEPRVPSDKPKQWKEISLEVNGEMVTVFSIGAVAKMLGCSIQTIRTWEKEGIIPATPLRRSPLSTDRLYTAEMIEEIKKLVGSRPKLGRTRSKQSEQAKQGEHNEEGNIGDRSVNS